MKPAIQVTNLTKSFTSVVRSPGIWGSIKSFIKPRYKEFTAVNDISFAVGEGELVGFIGANGAGKTTTMKMLSGLVYPTSGEVSVMGYTPFDRNQNFLKQISIVMGQKNQLWWDLPAIETFNLNRDIYEIPEKEYISMRDDLIDLLNLKKIVDVPVRKLSLGQRMKCEITAALLHRPRVLFLDEPTIGLDVVMQKNMRQFIKTYNEKYNTTIMLTSHYMEDVQYACQRIILISEGSILFDGSIADLMKRYADYKLIKVSFFNKIGKKDFPNTFGEVVSNNGWQVVIKIDRKNVASIIAALNTAYEVDDLDVMEPQLDEIVANLL